MSKKTDRIWVTTIDKRLEPARGPLQVLSSPRPVPVPEPEPEAEAEI